MSTIEQQVTDAFNGKGWPPGKDGPSMLVDAAAELRLLRQENERLRAMTEWQPMRTAPRDGTLVTLWHRCGSLIAGIAWNADEQKWYGMPEEEFVGWILLPTPPQTKASAEPQEKP